MKFKSFVTYICLLVTNLVFAGQSSDYKVLTKVKTIVILKEEMTEEGLEWIKKNAPGEEANYKKALEELNEMMLNVFTDNWKASSADIKLTASKDLKSVLSKAGTANTLLVDINRLKESPGLYTNPKLSDVYWKSELFKGKQFHKIDFIMMSNTKEALFAISLPASFPDYTGILYAVRKANRIADTGKNYEDDCNKEELNAIKTIYTAEEWVHEKAGEDGWGNVKVLPLSKLNDLVKETKGEIAIMFKYGTYYAVYGGTNYLTYNVKVIDMKTGFEVFKGKEDREEVVTKADLKAIKRCSTR